MPCRENVSGSGLWWLLYLFKGNLLFSSFLLIVTNWQIVDSNSKENIEEDEVAHDEENEEVEHEGAAKAGYSSVRLRTKVSGK